MVAVGGLVTRIFPGTAAAVVALGSVGAFDAALRPDSPDRQPARPDAASTAPRGGDPESTVPAACDAAPVSGSAARTPWGPVQVVATVDAAGGVCELHAEVYPDGDPRSQMINSRAIPMLDAAAARSGVEFDTVSGATYTSEAYRSSLQSILDSL